MRIIDGLNPETAIRRLFISMDRETAGYIADCIEEDLGELPDWDGSSIESIHNWRKNEWDLFYYSPVNSESPSEALPVAWMDLESLWESSKRIHRSAPVFFDLDRGVHLLVPWLLGPVESLRKLCDSLRQNLGADWNAPPAVDRVSFPASPEFPHDCEIIALVHFLNRIPMTAEREEQLGRGSHTDTRFFRFDAELISAGAFNGECVPSEEDWEDFDNAMGVFCLKELGHNGNAISWRQEEISALAAMAHLDIQSRVANLEEEISYFQTTLEPLGKCYEGLHRSWAGILPTRYGAKEVAVQALVREAPAAKAGMRSGDILISANGVRLWHPNILRVLVDATILGEAIEFEVKRNESIETVVVHPKKRELPVFEIV